MRIGIDCQSISNTSSGLGKYTRSLIDALKQIDSKNEYVLFNRKQDAGERTYDRLFWENGILPTKAFFSKLDILHTPAFSVPFIKGPWTSVVTIHDLIPIKFPGHLSRISRWYWKEWLPYVNSRTDFIIVDSQATKKDVVELLGVNPENIYVIYLAADEYFKRLREKSEIAKTLNKFSLNAPYLLYVGNVEPRKNLIRTICAYTNLRKNKKVELDLVIVGSRKWKFTEFDEKINQNPFRDNIKILNFVSDDDLACLYWATELFVYPSIYEGFGLPIVEAMTCQAPVLTSNCSSMPEVGGDAAYYVDPWKQDEIEAGILEIVYNQSLKTQMREKGLVQAQKFSWRRTAEQTLSVYERALKNKGFR